MARHRKTFRLACAPTAAAACLLACGEARAYEEQTSLDVSVGYVGLLDADHLPPHGASLALGSSVGLSSTLTLRGDVAALLLADDARTRPAGRARIEGLYLFDVLQVVPFAGVGLDLLVGEGRSGNVVARPGVHLVVGADYLLSRAWTLGLDVRGGVALESGGVLGSVDVALRVSRLFETF